MYKNLLIGSLIFIGTILNAEIYVKQNIKALYKSVKLTDQQKDYILDNQDNNINLIKKELEKEVKKLHIKNLNEKNIISFDLETNQEMKNFKFLKNSDERKIDKITKKAIKKVISKFKKPENKTPMRFIISFRKGENQKNIQYSNQKQNIENKEPYYIEISRGTTLFKYQSKEYTRVFETNKDGFINMTQNPRSCAKRVTILTENGQKIAEATGNLFSTINKEAAKGKYKILVQTKKDCNINLDYQ